VAHKAAGLGLHLLGFDPYLPPQQMAALGVEAVSLETLLRRADFVSIHCPLNEETRGLIGAAQLALMKPSACLINMARGPIVVQADLYRALANQTILAAAVDVLEQEPPAPDDPLLRLNNILITPHTSSGSVESILQLRRDTAQNVVDVLSGTLPRSIVNRKALGW
jgi:D-3-phosphoglycerate dehydrogenase